MSFRLDMIVENIRFQNGTNLSLKGNDLVIITGPNNSGKSSFLSEIYHGIRGDHTQSRIIQSVEVKRLFDPEDFVSYVLKNYLKEPDIHGNYHFFSTSFQIGYLNHVASGQTPMMSFAELFVYFAETKMRITEIEPAPIFDRTRIPPEAPIQRLFASVALEEKVSVRIRSAFDKDLIVHRSAGQNIPCYVGDRPDWTKENDRTSDEYISKLENLPRLEHEGDGIKSFAGIILRIMAFERPILIIDEPEAFLHPPQARLLGRILVEEQKKGVQIFIATHSTDVIKGVMEARPKALQLGRIVRDMASFHLHWLDSGSLQDFLGSPLMRATNALDALFHVKTILCEGDRDCVFYSEISRAVGQQTQVDALFINCNGKDRMPEFITSFKQLGLDPLVIVDIDIIIAPSTLRRMVTTKGGDADKLGRLAERVSKSVNDQSPPISLGALIKKINDIVRDSDDNRPPTREIIREIKSVLDEVAPFRMVKRAGWRAIPAGDAQRLYKELDMELQKLGIWIVPEGEIEGFLRTGGPKGQQWLSAALDRDSQVDAELSEAREFVRKVLSI